MGLEAVGAILGGLGALAGGTSGFVGGGQERSGSDWLDMENLKMAQRQEKLQEEMARFGISMRVADARQVGIHPLAALGINPAGGQVVPATFSSSSTGGRSRLREGLSSMGQGLERAALTMQFKSEHDLAQANLEKVKAETDFVATQAALSRQQLLDLKRKTPVVPPPDPYGPAPYSVVPPGQGIPNEDRWMNTESGIQRRYTSDAAIGIMADPINMWYDSARRFGGRVMRNYILHYPAEIAQRMVNRRLRAKKKAKR